MELLILGCGSAIPKIARNPSAQLLMFPNAHYLIDCAEGTQLRLLEEKIRPKYLKAIFISHLHGDHYLGLMGLLWSLDLAGRSAPLNLISPKGLSEIMSVQLKQAKSSFGYQLHHVELDEGSVDMVYQDQFILAKCFPLNHGVPCFGYRFEQQPARRKFRKDVVNDLKLNPKQIQAALANEAVFDTSGSLVDPARLFLPQATPLSYTYCTDTLAADFALHWLKGSTVLYHEATYTHDLVEKARLRFHTTALQAARVSKEAKVGQLIIGHYSSRYDNPKQLLDEAQTVFPNTVAAEDGLRIQIKSPILLPGST